MLSPLTAALECSLILIRGGLASWPIVLVIEYYVINNYYYGGGGGFKVADFVISISGGGGFITDISEDGELYRIRGYRVVQAQ